MGSHRAVLPTLCEKAGTGWNVTPILTVDGRIAIEKPVTAVARDVLDRATVTRLWRRYEESMAAQVIPAGDSLCSPEDGTPATGGRLPSGWRALTLLVVTCLPCGGFREIHASDDRVLRLSGGRRDLAGRRGRRAASPTRASADRRVRQCRLPSAVFLRSIPVRRVLRPFLHGVVSHLPPVSVSHRGGLLQPPLGIRAARNQTEGRAGGRRRVLLRDC